MDAESISSKFKQEKMKYNMDFTFKPEQINQCAEEILKGKNLLCFLPLTT